MIVLFTGVWVRELTLAKIFGSMPSRPMANRMRVWPYMVTRVTEKIEITAPTARMVAQTVLPVMISRIFDRPASDCPSKSVHGWAPMAEMATSR